jgi:hypothetical protein
MKMIRRVEKLERAMGVVVDPNWPTEFTIRYISPEDHSVVGTHVMKIEPLHVQRQRALAGLDRMTSKASSDTGHAIGK